MPVSGERVRPRRSPRLGYPPRRPVLTTEQAIRRSAEYRRLRALIRTPAGTCEFFQLWMRASREDATAALFSIFDEIVRTESLTPEELERLRTLIEVLLRG
jgi:hypothetical protein